MGENQNKSQEEVRNNLPLNNHIFGFIPSGFTLKLVQLFHRHGERAPLAYTQSFGFEGLGLCSEEPFVSHLNPLPRKEDGTRGSTFRVIYEDRQKKVFGNCKPGELTDQGKKTMFNLGQNFNKMYVQTNFLKETPDPQEIKVFSTEIARAIESAKHLLEGMFPTINQENSVDIIVREEKNEYFYPNFNHCPNLKKFYNEARKLVEKEHKHDVDNFKENLSHLIPNNERFSAFSLFDYFYASKAHGIPTPREIDEKTYEKLERYSTDIFFLPLYSNQTLLQLSIGQVIHDIVHNIEKSVARSDPTKMYFYSAHDATIAPLLVSYKVFDRKWPPFAANLLVELFESNYNSQMYVRIKYNNKPLEIPECQQSAIEKGTLCPLERFKQISSHYISPDYKYDCHDPNKKMT